MSETLWPVFQGGGSTDTANTISLDDEIIRQSCDAGWDNFICRSCRHWLGGWRCSKDIFVAFEGANMSICKLYERERREAKLK